VANTNVFIVMLMGAATARGVRWARFHSYWDPHLRNTYLLT